MNGDYRVFCCRGSGRVPRCDGAWGGILRVVGIVGGVGMLGV